MLHENLMLLDTGDEKFSQQCSGALIELMLIPSVGKCLSESSNQTLKR